MKITVITVAYNSGSTIADTLRSVAEQHHPDVEHIVIDGGSTDNTVELVQRLGRDGTLLLSEPDTGIYDAMNKGLRLASGDFVGFLNADDMFAGAATLETMAKPMVQADIVYGDLVYVHQNDTGRVIRHWRSGRFDRSRLRYGWMPPHPTFYVRRSRLAGMQFDLRYRIAADYDFMLRQLTPPTVRVTYVPEVLVRMRTGGASNRSLHALWQKSSEDYLALRRNEVGGLMSLASKIARKIPQYFKH